MRRIGLLWVVLGLVAAACGGGDTATPVGGGNDTGTVTSLAAESGGTTGTPSGDDSAATTGPPGDDPAQIDGPPAPDFTLALSDGSEFVLSAEQKPVYLIFWAEW